MTYGMARREEVEYLKLVTIVSAIISAGKIAGGGDPGDSLRNTLKDLRSSLFPEIQAGLIATAEKNVKILEEEYKRGPLKVKAREYAKRKKRQR